MDPVTTTPWDALRARPGMYAGDNTISSFRAFLYGWDMANARHGIQDDSLRLPPDISSWVAYREHLTMGSLGWSWMLQNRYSDETVALTRFFELLDEYAVRVPREFAYVENHSLTVSRCYPESGDIVLSGRLSLRVYTDDPGYFRHFPPHYSWLRDRLCSARELGDLEGLIVTDQAIYERLLAEKAELEHLEKAKEPEEGA